MKRLIPFVFTTFGVLLAVSLVTAYRFGLFAKLAELRQEHIEEIVVDSQEPA